MAQSPPGRSEALRDQLLREWPPGYGGVERVAHELAQIWGGRVFSFDASRLSKQHDDPLEVTYPRMRLPCISAVGRLRLPRPSKRLWALVWDSRPLHGHLPSPGVLLVLVICKVVQPRRCVTAHWHSFLEGSGGLEAALIPLYQWLALKMLPHLSAVITTSPALADELGRHGCHRQIVTTLPCCLGGEQEAAALALPLKQAQPEQPLRVLFIGRLDSYKRLDWLLEALAPLKHPWSLAIVGDGPKREEWQQQSRQYCGADATIQFHGQLSESDKLTQLAKADLLVLPSERCNEAFGIVQLEAMAAGIPSVAFQLARSGMGWVGQLPSLQWSQTPSGLHLLLESLANDCHLRGQLNHESRERYLKLFSRQVWLRDLSKFNPETKARFR